MDYTKEQLRQYLLFKIECYIFSNLIQITKIRNLSGESPRQWRQRGLLPTALSQHARTLQGQFAGNKARSLYVWIFKIGKY